MKVLHDYSAGMTLRVGIADFYDENTKCRDCSRKFKDGDYMSVLISEKNGKVALDHYCWKCDVDELEASRLRDWTSQEYESEIRKGMERVKIEYRRRKLEKIDD